MFSLKNKNETLILIVDDSSDNLELLKIVLESRGYQVQCASNGVEALSLLHKLPVLPDLVFLDAQMPQMDGYQFRVEQLKVERLKSIPVVIMTGDSDKKMTENMLAPQHILIKPIDIKRLLACIPTFL